MKDFLSFLTSILAVFLIVTGISTTIIFSDASNEAKLWISIICISIFCILAFPFLPYADRIIDMIQKPFKPLSRIFYSKSGFPDIEKLKGQDSHTIFYDITFENKLADWVSEIHDQDNITSYEDMMIEIQEIFPDATHHMIVVSFAAHILMAYEQNLWQSGSYLDETEDGLPFFTIAIQLYGEFMQSVRQNKRHQLILDHLKACEDALKSINGERDYKNDEYSDRIEAIENQCNNILTQDYFDWQERVIAQYARKHIIK